MILNLRRKLLYSLALILKKETKGFTLIELTVVFLFTSTLVAVAIPTFLDQVGKARESETKLIMGTIARQQQVFHVEKKTFASNLNLLDIDFRQQYHVITVPTADQNIVKHQVIAINPTDDVRNYAVGVYFNNGLFDIAVCQSAVVNVPVDVGDTPASNCTNNGVRIQ
ncbi:type IV pilin protein [Geminocystis sp. NIES-3709]|uniref:type IV pilin protein n=1 Tax=Geminocystis sp. NIES-3709 TaxID=1617448 RepID=UPI0005FC544F|nr:type IV pilin-like G/H family protein [Geminocystis sp. NIES-3709]BAQ63362.1 type IV pilin PilA [Geminocystis sp. NIES-3709]